MPEKDKIFQSKIKHTGIFDLASIYRFAYDWLVDEGYIVTEKTYSEKIKPDGKEIEIEWEAKKKISDYFRFNMKMKWHVIGMVEVEVNKEGKKVKMNKALIEIRSQGILEKDYEGRWEGHAFNKFLRGIYDKYIIRGRIEQYEEKLFKESDEILAQIKSFLAQEGLHRA